MAGWSDALFLDQDRGRDVAEDEMAVAVAPVEVSRTDFGIDDQHALRMAGADIVGGGLDAEGRRRAGDVHVEGEAVDAQRILDLDCHPGIGALPVRRGAQPGLDGARVPARAGGPGPGPRE